MGLPGEGGRGLIESLPDCMVGTFDAGLEAGAEVVGPAGQGGLDTGNCQDHLGHKAAENLADADRSYSWFLVQGDQSARHHASDCGGR